jgi:DNA-binding NtrC family response regulator
MAKDLTTSSIDRQNILNNPYALAEIEKAAGIRGIPFEGKTVVLKEQVAEFFDVTPRTVENYVERHAEELARPQLSFSEEALQMLASYSWPGNIRELENLVERVSILSDGDEIIAEQLPQLMQTTPRVALPQMSDFVLPTFGVDFNALVDDYENKLIVTALSQTGGNKKAAAKLLGLNRTTLVEKIKKKGLEARIEVTAGNDDGII